jgi:hypothetical protein
MNHLNTIQFDASRLFVDHDIDYIDPPTQVEPLTGRRGRQTVDKFRYLFGHFLCSEFGVAVRIEIPKFRAQITVCGHWERLKSSPSNVKDRRRIHQMRQVLTRVDWDPVGVCEGGPGLLMFRQRRCPAIVSRCRWHQQKCCSHYRYQSKTSIWKGFPVPCTIIRYLWAPNSFKKKTEFCTCFWRVLYLFSQLSVSLLCIHAGELCAPLQELCATQRINLKNAVG